jgi:hypothetical protein
LVFADFIGVLPAKCRFFQQEANYRCWWKGGQHAKTLGSAGCWRLAVVEHMDRNGPGTHTIATAADTDARLSRWRLRERPGQRQLPFDLQRLPAGGLWALLLGSAVALVVLQTVAVALRMLAPLLPL